MKTYSTIFLSLFCSISLAQNNIGFEKGTTEGWICKYGYYGSASCPTSSCERFPAVWTGYGQLNTGGINAPTNSSGDRHVITAGLGTDTNSNGLVTVVAPGGGNYSFRLGNGIAGGVNGKYAQAEAIRTTFFVTNQNAAFTYKYAFFITGSWHPFEQQPGLEVMVLDSNESLMPCGRFFTTWGNYPNCYSPTGFQNGTNGYVIKNWTDVGLDLTPYLGQNITIEFKTTDCYTDYYARQTCQTSCASNNCTYCCYGCCCTFSSPMTSCTLPPRSCNIYYNGSHSSYAYIDASVSPMTIQAPAFCAGTDSILLCAPSGYASYSWPSGQSGIIGSPITQCVTVNNPVAGNTYTVNMVSITGCPSTATVTLQEAILGVNSETICAGDSTILTASGGSNYLWNTSETTTSITVKPSANSIYTVTSQTGTCTALATSTVAVSNNFFPSVNGNASICLGKTATLTAFGGTSYSWSTGAIGSSMLVAPSTATTYTLYASRGSCSGSASATLFILPSPPIPSITVSGTVLISSSSTGNQWYLNGNPINCGGIAQTYTVTENGIYTVCVTDSNWCTVCSDPYNFTTTSVIDAEKELDILIFPNPTTNTLNINYQGSLKEIFITDVVGKVVLAVDKNAKSISIPSFSPGIYFLNMKSESRTLIRKIIIE